MYENQYRITSPRAKYRAGIDCGLHPDERPGSAEDEN